MHSFAFVNRFTTILPSRRTIKLVEKEMKTFDDLIYLNEQDKQLIRDSIQIYYSQIQRIRANALFFGGITWGILFYIVLAILLIFWNQILSLYFKVHSYNINLSIEFTGNNAQIYLPTFIPIVFFTSVFSLGLFVILSTIITIIFKLETRGLLITSFISVLIPEIICFSIINNSYSNSIILFNSSTYNLLSGLVAIMIFSPFSFLLFFSVAIVIFVYKTIQKSHYPIAVVISNLISILDHVKDHEKDWNALHITYLYVLKVEI